MKRLPSTIFDPFLLSLLATVALAILLPARGVALVVVDHAVTAAIALLFLVYGMRLAPGVVVRGLAHWRLQGLVLGATFVLFPLVGLVVSHAVRPWLPGALATGLLFVGVLPSTVQSSIAFTAVARGNVSAALCGASISNLIGMIATPLLVALLMGAGGGALRLDGLRDIALQLLLPFVVGQMLRPALGAWVLARPRLTMVVDRGSILVVVYAAFSEGMATGVWRLVTPLDFAAILALDALMLAAILGATAWLARRLRFSEEDVIAIVFCGSKKSLAAGIPMANILFAGQATSLILLPVMVFHQLQLFVCAALARRWSRRRDGGRSRGGAGPIRTADAPVPGRHA